MRIIHRLAALSMLAVASFGLAGCASTGGNVLSDTIGAVTSFSISQQTVDAARAGYDGAVLVPMAKYAQWPRCRTGQSITLSNPCHDRSLLKRLRAADKVVAQGFANTQAAIDRGDNVGISAAWNALQTAISSAKQLVALTGAST